ncbi:hypothetical protein AB0M43_06415 [Longispora sp. NPDC051575]|uniref:helix-turn-helix transcriptional regulator n=1 Tax=Longispora sp. NPDC051575 TaxID=3154943 RepID=UPI003438B476
MSYPRHSTAPGSAQTLTPDNLEASLVQARGFLDEALRVSRETRSATDTHIEYHSQGWRTAARMLLRGVHREYVLASSGASVCSMEQLDLQSRLVGEMVARDIGVRHLFNPGALARPSVQKYAESVARRGAKVRVSASKFQDTIIVDGRSAVVWGRNGIYDEQCLVIRGTVVLDGLHRLLNVVWDSASDLETYQRWHGDESAELTVAIVGMLNAGYKDDAAARQLGMSVRTYRRHVAEILRRLGAGSRFQAGARAVQLGLLPA